MWAQAGTDLDFPIAFMVDEDYVIPTTASVTVLSTLGTPLVPTTPLEVDSTSTIFTIPAGVTQIPAGQDFATLFVKTRFVASGGLHEQTDFIYLVPFIPITVTPADVRHLLGVTATEVSDAEIRIYPAYFRLASRFLGFEEALTEGDQTTIQANRAVALEAALELLPALQLRVAQKIRSEDQEFSRFQDTDWEMLRQQLSSQLEAALETVTGVDEDLTITRFVFAQPTDPITGG